MSMMLFFCFLLILWKCLSYIAGIMGRVSKKIATHSKSKTSSSSKAERKDEGVSLSRKGRGPLESFKRSTKKEKVEFKRELLKERLKTEADELKKKKRKKKQAVQPVMPMADVLGALNEEMALEENKLDSGKKPKPKRKTTLKAKEKRKTFLRNVQALSHMIKSSKGVSSSSS